jgi:pentatricopeptide repeat protein
VFFAAALDMFSRSHALEKALGLLSVMESEFQLPPDTHIFNLVLSACVSAKDVQTGWSVREMMRERNVAPDTTTIAQLIALCNQRHQRWEQKHQAWTRNERQHPHPYEDTERQQKQVSKWFDDIFADIQQHGIVPDAMIFSALMSFWSPDIKRSWDFFQTMLDSVRHTSRHTSSSSSSS